MFSGPWAEAAPWTWDCVKRATAASVQYSTLVISSQDWSHAIWYATVLSQSPIRCFPWPYYTFPRQAVAWVERTVSPELNVTSSEQLEKTHQLPNRYYGRRRESQLRALTPQTAWDRATTSASRAGRVVKVCLLDCQGIKYSVPLVSSTNRIKIPLLGKGKVCE